MAATASTKTAKPELPATVTTTTKALLSRVYPVTDEVERCICKVSVIGAGTIGTAIAFALLSQGITTELVLMDMDASMARAEMLDIQHAIMYLGCPIIKASNDYKDLENTRICILTVGARGCGCEEDKIEAVNRNSEIFKVIVPEIVRRSPECILIVVSHPVEIMTYVAWKISGFPPHRVMGLGTVLESACFRRLVAERLGVCIKCCQAFIIGEQGKNSMWSSVSVSGVRLKLVNPDLGTEDDPEDWAELHRHVSTSTAEVTKLKTMGSWGIALSVSRIVKVILQDKKECMPVSTHIKGCRHGIDKDVFVSLPCIIGKHGIEYLVRQDLSGEEREKLQNSADSMNEIQKTLSLPEGVYLLYRESRQGVADRGDRGGSSKMIPPTPKPAKKAHHEHKHKHKKEKHAVKGSPRPELAKGKKEQTSEDEFAEEGPVKKRPIRPPLKGGSSDIVYRDDIEEIDKSEDVVSQP